MAKSIPRDEELGTKEQVEEKLLDMFKDIEEAFRSSHDRSDDILDYWDLFNCKLGGRQFYNGNSQVFVPIVKAAVKARKTRFVNQIFPQSMKCVEVTTSEADIPDAQMALLEHYIRTTRLRTEVLPALCVNGDVEGQYSLYVSWEKCEKRTARRVQKPIQSQGLEFEELGTTDDMEEEELVEEGPDVEVISDNDILVLPVTAKSIKQALRKGGSVTIIRRWSKADIKRMIDDGDMIEARAKPLLKNASAKKPDDQNRDTAKNLASAAGIKTSGGDKFILGYETWSKVKVGGEHRLCRSYYGGDNVILGCKQNPYWCDEVPLISCAVDKMANVFKGVPPVADVIDMAVAANDIMNEGMDNGHFGAMPIIMTDPDKNPKVGTMVLGLASIWETSPKDTQFAQFPDTSKMTLEKIAALKNEIFQILGVNPAMLPQQTGAKNKRNQAEIANEQQVDILTTADAVTVLEEGILTPLLQWFVWLDHQFRDREITVKQFGEMGLKANMQEVPVLQSTTKYEYRWFGVEEARNAQRLQQQIAGVNVIKGLPPEMYSGYKLNLSPMIQRMVDGLFGYRLGPLIFEKVQGITVDPEMENALMDQGFDAPVHPDDDDMAHMQVHMQGMQQSMGDLHGKYRPHMLQHQQQMQAKAHAAAAQQGPQGLPGGPGGAGPGVAGAPKPGAQPSGPRLIKGPEGSIPQDQMPRAGSVGMPRKF